MYPSSLMNVHCVSQISKHLIQSCECDLAPVDFLDRQYVLSAALVGIQDDCSFGSDLYFE